LTNTGTKTRLSDKRLSNQAQNKAGAIPENRNETRWKYKYFTTTERKDSGHMHINLHPQNTMQ